MWESPTVINLSRRLALKLGWWFSAAVALCVIFSLMGGCQLLMPKEIRNIEAGLQKDAANFKRENPTAFHEYQAGARTMRYVEVGSRADDKPLVLFVHGSPGEWQGWVRYLQDADLRRETHMIAVDRPGFGGSRGVGAERSLAQQCRDIAPLLDRASPGRRVLLVGHSFGGPVVSELAMEYPKKISDLLILAGSIDPAQEKTLWYQYVADWSILAWMLPPELVTANREIMALKGGLNDMLPRWDGIQQRVTVIQGEADTLVPPANADFAEAHLTHAQSLKIIRIPKMNHFLPWKQFPVVKSEILRHLP